MSAENQIVIYHDDKQGIRLEARLEEDTVWLSQRQIVELFQTAKSTVSEHIKNIFAESELLPEATVRKIRTVQQEGVRKVSHTQAEEKAKVEYKKFKAKTLEQVEADYLKAITVLEQQAKKESQKKRGEA